MLQSNSKFVIDKCRNSAKRENIRVVLIGYGAMKEIIEKVLIQGESIGKLAQAVLKQKFKRKTQKRKYGYCNLCFYRGPYRIEI